MGHLRAHGVHPDMVEMLGQMVETLGQMAATPENDPVVQPAPVLLRLTSGNRQRVVVRDCVCWLEERGNGTTRVHLITGRNVAVDEDVDDVADLMEIT